MENFNCKDDLTELPVVPLRGLVVFPDMTLHFDVGRKKSAAALKYAMKTNQKIFLVSQRDASVDDPEINDIYRVGVVCNIKQMLRIPNSDNLRVVVEGTARGELLALEKTKPFLSGPVAFLGNNTAEEEAPQEKAYRRLLKKEFEKYASLIRKVSSDVIATIISLNDSGKLADYVCYNTFLDYTDKQQILETLIPTDRLSKLLVLLNKENATLEIEAEIQKKVQDEIDKNQRDYYLREEMKVIADTLGDSDNPVEEGEEYKERIAALDCTDEVREKLLKECDKLIRMPFGSHEGTVVRTYLDKCLEIPFGKYSKDSIHLEKSGRILDKDHYGLEKVKERILESLAVMKRNSGLAGQIICLSGPPGVGKTSIVRSLARSMNRKYVRVALGGIHDEAEIRGHRKTYIGSMPGRIVSAVIRSGVMNPVILLDEIDKVGADYKGDPSSALLEALDPEQNMHFTDHYIDFPVDLSKTLFITTANDTSTIAAPLLDRMEVIELNSYTVEEKFHIAKEHLVKKELKKHGLTARECRFSNDALYEMIESYTREAGVRNLEKTIAAVCRKAVVSLEKDQRAVRVTAKNIEEFLGVKRFSKDQVPKDNLIGTVNGLAWTSIGGTMLPIEISALNGTGKIMITGNLGNVMQESVKTAVSYIRSRAKEYGINPDFYKEKDIHIHAPEAAVPKDGPSAGLAITTALISELTGIPIKRTVAMTGEISLKGKALPIGGLKEKSMAAYKAGCTTVIIPKDNEKDLAEISDEVRAGLEFIGVTSYDEIIPVALTEVPRYSQNNSNIVIGSSQDDRAIAQ